MASRQKTLTPFVPAPVRPRHDGWTAQRQIDFISALAETACVETACRRVGVSRQSAYRLRARDCAGAFRAAWDQALDVGVTQLEEAALSRALHGVPRPIFYKGEQVGETRDYDERLTMFLLRARRPQRFGKWIERMLGPDGQDVVCDPAQRLAGELDAIEFTAPADDGYELPEND
jgi:hypothetical protein